MEGEQAVAQLPKDSGSGAQGMPAARPRLVVPRVDRLPTRCRRRR